MSPSGKAPDFDSGIRRFKSGHPSQQKRDANASLFCWLAWAPVRTEPQMRRRCTFAARRSGSSLTRRRACESRSEAELPARSPHNTKTVDRFEPPHRRGVLRTPAGDQWSPPYQIKNYLQKHRCNGILGRFGLLKPSSGRKVAREA